MGYHPLVSFRPRCGRPADEPRTCLSVCSFVAALRSALMLRFEGKHVPFMYSECADVCPFDSSRNSLYGGLCKQNCIQWGMCMCALVLPDMRVRSHPVPVHWMCSREHPSALLAGEARFQPNKRLLGVHPVCMQIFCPFLRGGAGRPKELLLCIGCVMGVMFVSVLWLNLNPLVFAFAHKSQYADARFKCVFEELLLGRCQCSYCQCCWFFRGSAAVAHTDLLWSDDQKNNNSQEIDLSTLRPHRL